MSFAGSGPFILFVLAMSTPAIGQEPRRILTLQEAADIAIVDAGAGTSGLKAIETRLLLGDTLRYRN